MRVALCTQPAHPAASRSSGQDANRQPRTPAPGPQGAAVRALVLACAGAAAALAAWATPARAQTEVWALAGKPFGVGHFVAPLGAEEAARVFDDHQFVLEEKSGRALYPAFRVIVQTPLLTRLLGVKSRPASVEVCFLFTGDAPLELTLANETTSRSLTLRPTPSESPERAAAALGAWREQYVGAAKRQIEQGDYPPLAQVYLTCMLSRRLGLPTPTAEELGLQQPGEPLRTLELLMASEVLHATAIREAFAQAEARVGHEPAADKADLPVPAPIAWPARPARKDDDPKKDASQDDKALADKPQADPAKADASKEDALADAAPKIEPLAQRVPAECFFVHFHEFSNFLWLRNLTEEHGGDLGRMLSLRGHDARRNERMERQLAVKTTLLAELFGGAVISDMALIGTDFYQTDGACLGLLFESANPLLTASLGQERAAALEREKARGAKFTEVEIAGRKVSLLATPDNRLRSFLASDGGYHLVTNSRYLVERFLETCDKKGAGSLGQDAEFVAARRRQPRHEADALFVYASSAFLRNLASPTYQIELQRRLRAQAEMEMLLLARLAAKGEGLKSDAVADLVAAGLLPTGFAARPDGSTVVEADGRWLDSARGARGAFLPIPDASLAGVTAAEAELFNARAAYYLREWRDFDPLLVSVKRFALPEVKDRERVVIDARITLAAAEQQSWLLDMLGAPSKRRLKPVAGNVISLQAVLRGGSAYPNVPEHHLFLGVQDETPSGRLQTDGLLQLLRTAQAAPGYLGAWPKMGFLDLLPLRRKEPDAMGYTPLILGLWRWERDSWSVLSFNRPLLDRITPALSVEDAATAAQVRVEVGELGGSKLRGWANDLGYQRAVKTSVGNVRLLHALTQQLRVPPEQALETAQRLLHVELLCALGGEYRRVDNAAGRQHWTSTRWPADLAGGEPATPADFEAYLLTWMRGLRAEIIKDEGQLLAHAEIDIQRKPTEPKFELPLFNLFNGGDKK